MSYLSCAEMKMNVLVVYRLFSRLGCFEFSDVIEGLYTSYDTLLVPTHSTSDKVVVTANKIRYQARPGIYISYICTPSRWFENVLWKRKKKAYLALFAFSDNDQLADGISSSFSTSPLC